MIRWTLVALLVMLGVLAFAPPAAIARVEVVISDGGFDPPEVDYYEWTYDPFTAQLYYTGTSVEIPTEEITYNWSIWRVYQDGYNVTGFGAYGTDFDNPTSQNTTLGAYVYDDGWWVIWVDCEVTYPDGYAKVFRQPMYIHADEAIATAKSAEEKSVLQPIKG